MPFRIDIGERLHTARTARGMSQRALAHVSGVPQSQISKIETGVIRDPAVSTAARLAEALTVTVEALLAADPRQLIDALTHSVDGVPEDRRPVSATDARTIATSRLTQIASADCAQDLLRWVTERRVMLICGGRGAGTTTLLGVLGTLIDATDRVFVVHDDDPVAVSHPQTTAINVRGGDPRQYLDALRIAARYSDDRMIIDRISGSEAFAALDLLRTGHHGSMLALHATQPVAAVTRMLSLAAAAPDARHATLSLASVFGDVIDLIVCLAGRDDPNAAPRISSVSQVLPSFDGPPGLHHLHLLRDGRLGRVAAPARTVTWDRRPHG